MNAQIHSPALLELVTASEIEGIHEAVIQAYFETLNAGEFDATAALFATDGMLQPPFEPAIVGRDKIAAYLHREAQGINLQPIRGSATLLENGCTECQISGKVQTPLFGVNVAWLLILSPTHEIFVARINLLASLKELVNLRDRR